MIQLTLCRWTTGSSMGFNGNGRVGARTRRTPSAMGGGVQSGAPARRPLCEYVKEG